MNKPPATSHQPPATKLSAIIIAKNEEEIIGDCLESVKWANEIIIVDTGSKDKTVKIAQRYTDRIFNYSGGSFSDWRNFGAQKAKSNWLLYVDADERVTPLLKKEIQVVTSHQRPATRKKLVTDHQSPITSHSAFAIPRRNIRLGKEMRFGGWWPDYVLRLMIKDKLRRWKGELHEQPEIEGEIGKLKNALIHFSHRGSIEHKMVNTIGWSKIEAELLVKTGHPQMNACRFLSAMGREFFDRMVRKQAWRDGTEGIVEGTYQVFSVFISYARLWEMQMKGKPDDFFNQPVGLGKEI